VHDPRIRLVVLSTAVGAGAGGVAVALAGFLRGVERAGGLGAHLVTHRVGEASRLTPALGAALRLRGVLAGLRRAGHTPVVYGHAGGMLDVARISALLRLARALGAPTALQLHSVTMADWLDGPRGRALRLLLTAADVRCAATALWADTFAAHGLGPCRVVPNALPPDAEAALDTPPAPSRRRGLRVGTMTRLVPGKGVDLLVDALSHLPPGDTLIVAGEGPEREALEARAAAAGVAGRVRFAGWVDPDHKDAFFRELDLFALPSRYDSFGMGLIEAMARGVPVVGLDGGAARDVLRDGVEGRLAPPTAEGVAAAIDALRDANRRAEAARAAQAGVRARFSPDAVAAAALSAATEAAQRRGRR
jgi:glycosyltransferase involved in cell wall biosynthesis